MRSSLADINVVTVRSPLLYYIKDSDLINSVCYDSNCDSLSSLYPVTIQNINYLSLAVVINIDFSGMRNIQLTISE